MSETIPIPKMSEILMEEFMEPMGLSAYRLAQEIHVPASRIQDILHSIRQRCNKEFCLYLENAYPEKRAG